MVLFFRLYGEIFSPLVFYLFGPLDSVYGPSLHKTSLSGFVIYSGLALNNGFTYRLVGFAHAFSRRVKNVAKLDVGPFMSMRSGNTDAGNSLNTEGYGTVCAVVNQMWA